MRLEQRKCVRAEWGTTDGNRKARFYRITTAGRRELTAEKARWGQMSAIIGALLESS